MDIAYKSAPTHCSKNRGKLRPIAAALQHERPSEQPRRGQDWVHRHGCQPLESRAFWLAGRFT